MCRRRGESGEGIGGTGEKRGGELPPQYREEKLSSEKTEGN